MLQHTTEYTRFDNQKEGLKRMLCVSGSLTFLGCLKHFVLALEMKKGDSMYVTVT